MTGNKKVVLVVEDEKPLQEAIKLKLEKNDYEVVSARSVEQAKEYVDSVPKLDAIWLDHYLIGKENGLDFIAWCKGGSSPKCLEIPVFVVSNTASSDKVSSYLSFGSTKYYVKSNFKLDEIIKDISDSLR